MSSREHNKETNKGKWERVYRIWKNMPPGAGKNLVSETYQSIYKEGYKTGGMEVQDAMELALIQHGYLPPISVMETGQQEYDEIQQGAEIWASIQRSSGT